MPGGWVYPGGVVEPIDASPVVSRLLPDAPVDQLPVMGAAVRELVEEVGIWLTDRPVAATTGGERPEGNAVYLAAAMAGVRFAAGRLVYLANWVTPTMLPRRYDTHFFAAPAPTHAVAVPDGNEIDDAAWIPPAEAIRRAERDDWQLSPPTLRTLDQLRDHETFADLSDAVAAAGPVIPARPRLRFSAGRMDAIAPGEPGFDDLEDLPPDPEMLNALGRIQRPTPPGPRHD
jgi:8-oxo-dGTP pyrophosphatase MutT (NUDIX family)